MQQPRPLIITGGHVTPALAVIDVMQARNFKVPIIFVGRQYNNNSEETLSFEYREVTKRSVPFIHLTTGRFTRSMNMSTFFDVLRIPLGFINAFWILITHRPTAILSFGGYLALPMALVGFILGISIYTHEQTRELGLTNRIIGRVAKKIFTSFPETQNSSLVHKIHYTGNPLRSGITSFIKKNISQPTKSSLPLIYITGGSLGSHAINSYIEYNLSALLEKYHLIHQTGNVAEFNDYERIRLLRESLPDDKRTHYELYTHIPSDEVGDIMQRADLIVSRSGANTFFELIALSKPSVLIPLPWSAAQEQQKHAQILKDAGVATIVDQGDSNEHFLHVINTMISQTQSYEDAFKQLQKRYITEASDIIVDAIFKNT
ncbi:MAG: UDP-N-acetylglucosamine--N-acetylmuramyl-(pentapeptide) pyrophosphoryl-undecaprenol N-acetylglucosamine transferase [bacterium]|nr:UDP-N-acetylglucosamine--N-acetylmuramyl-(pentapeptide) pyrophosphoryl-undecaprenol N-acetylglucosamine transferase [bacterium]